MLCVRRGGDVCEEGKMEPLNGLKAKFSKSLHQNCKKLLQTKFQVPSI